MPARLPKVELYWVPVYGPCSTGMNGPDEIVDAKVNWRLKAANGEVLCHCTQGFQDKTDAMRNLTAVAGAFFGDVDRVRVVGPGKKPS